MPFDAKMIEARLSLNLITPREMPKIAWDALEAGLDGPAIRRLAALEMPTWFEVNEVMPAAMLEMGVARISAGEGAAYIAYRRARGILDSSADPLKHTSEFERLWIASGYSSEIRELGTLDDDVHVSRLMKRNEQTIRENVTQTLKEFVTKHEK
jgi:hypothetical protein